MSVRSLKSMISLKPFVNPTDLTDFIDFIDQIDRFIMLLFISVNI
jgi:hypothetical protein